MFIAQKQNTTIPVCTHTVHYSPVWLYGWGGGLFPNHYLQFQRAIFRLKWKYITVHGWLSCDSFKNDLIGWIFRVHSAGNGSNISGRHLHCVKVISWKDVCTFRLWNIHSASTLAPLRVTFSSASNRLLRRTSPITVPTPVIPNPSLVVDLPSLSL